MMSRTFFQRRSRSSRLNTALLHSGLHSTDTGILLHGWLECTIAWVRCSLGAEPGYARASDMSGAAQGVTRICWWPGKLTDRCFCPASLWKSAELALRFFAELLQSPCSTRALYYKG